MTNADMLDRAIDEILSGRSESTAVLAAEEAGLAVHASRIAAAVRAVPESTGRADIRRRVLTTALRERPRRRLSRWFVLVPSTVLLLGGGIAVASTRAVPGDALYSVRRGLSAVRLAVTIGDQAKAVALLNRAERSLADAERLGAEGHKKRLVQALRVFAGDVANARASIALIAAGERADLDALANRLVARAGMLESSIPNPGRARAGAVRGGPSGSDGEPGPSDRGDRPGLGNAKHDEGRPGKGPDDNPADLNGEKSKQSSRSRRGGDQD